MYLTNEACILKESAKVDRPPPPKTAFTPEHTMSGSTFPVLNPEEQAINDGGMAQEISGITEGRLGDGYVTVAVSDKSSKDKTNCRDGTGEVAISYQDGSTTKYEVINFVKMDGTACDTTFKVDGKTRQMGGFEDVSYNSAMDTYSFVQEGGPETYDPTIDEKVFQDPVILQAKLVVLGDGTHAMQLTGKSIVVPSKTLIDAYTENGTNGIEGMAFDKSGNAYVGFQDSGNIYKGTLQSDGTYLWGAGPVLKTNHTDLAGMAFDSSGNLLVSFGNYSDGTGLENSSFCKMRMYELAKPSPGQPETWTKNEAYSMDINATGPSVHDAEAIMVDHNGNIVVGSDNQSERGQQLKNLTQDLTVLNQDSA